MAASHETRWRISSRQSKEIRRKERLVDPIKSDILMTAGVDVLKPLYNVALRHL
jgi:hypothetical protein